MDKKTNISKSDIIVKKQSSRRNYFVGRNMKEWHKRKQSSQEIKERRWSIMGRQWNCLH